MCVIVVPSTFTSKSIVPVEVIGLPETVMVSEVIPTLVTLPPPRPEMKFPLVIFFVADPS